MVKLWWWDNDNLKNVMPFLCAWVHIIGHETMVSAVCLSIFLWICDMAGLLHGTFVSWWYLPRIWPSVTDIQHYYHGRYPPTDDWHLAYMISLVYFSVEACLKGVFPHFVSTWRESCVRIYAPPPPPPPPHEKNKQTKSNRGDPVLQARGEFELTHGSACIIGW